MTLVWKDSHKDLGTFKVFYEGIPKTNVINLSAPTLTPGIVIGYFDGASQEARLKCGTGALLIINNSICFQLKMGCRGGTNTKGELKSLWTVLFFLQIYCKLQLYRS